MNSTYNLFVNFAATYNCGAYGTGTYNESSCKTTTGTTGGTTSDGGLADTGMSVYLPLAGGIILIAIAAILLVRTLRRKR